MWSTLFHVPGATLRYSAPGDPHPLNARRGPGIPPAPADLGVDYTVAEAIVFIVIDRLAGGFGWEGQAGGKGGKRWQGWAGRRAAHPA